MKTVKGVWTFKDLLTNDFPSGRQVVTFTSNGESFTGIEACYFEAAPTLALCYRRDYAGELEWHNSMYFFEPFEHSGDYYEIGWDRGYEAYKTIDFGETEQTVSDEFYDWLTRNAFAEKVEITITENGTLTLATAGKYCHRNIDVNVDVPSYEAELAEQKAITDGILNRKITEYVNNTVTELETYALAFCTKMTKLRCGAVEKMENYSVRYCTSLTEARFDSVKTIKAQVFQNCNKMVKLILGSPSLCELTNVNSFNLTPIADGTGYVYVPDNLVDAYKTATNWSTFANQIKPISELGE